MQSFQALAWMVRSLADEAVMRSADVTSSEPLIRSASQSSSQRETTNAATEQFAAVLSTTRQSSREVLGIVAAYNDAAKTRRETRQREAAQSPEPNENSARARRKNAARPGSEKSTRLDRIRDEARRKSDAEAMQGDAQPAQIKEHAFAETAAESSVAAIQTQSDVAAQPSRTATNGSASGTTEAATSSVQTASPALSPTTPATQNTAPAAEPVMQPPTESAPSASASTQAVEAKAPNTSVTNNAGADAQGSNQQQKSDTSATAAANRTTTAANRSTATANDFQQLLGQLGRQRGVETGHAQTLSTAALKGKTETSSTEATVDLDSTGSIRDLARIVRTQIGADKSSMKIDLAPAELGRMRVDVHMADGQVAVHFQAETLEAREAIRDRLDDLKGALQQQGIRVDRMDVDYLPPASHSGQQNPTANQDQAGNYWQQPAETNQWQGSQQNTRRNSGDESDGTSGNGTWEPQVAGSAAVPELAAGWQAQTGVDLVA